MSKQTPATPAQTPASDPAQPLSPAEQPLAVFEEQFRALFGPRSRDSRADYQDPVEHSR